MKILANGDRKWYLNGELHREDGPAIEYADGGQEWWINDKRHKKDGPAAERVNGSREWWINGVRFFPEEKLESNVHIIPNNCCSICMFDFEQVENLYETQCKHTFHIECLSTWVRINKTCPLCRNSI